MKKLIITVLASGWMDRKPIEPIILSDIYKPEEKIMKLQNVFTVSLFVLTVFCATNVKATTSIPLPTPPDKIPLIKENVGSQPKMINLNCPKTIQVGPVGIPTGWQSLGSLPRQRLNIQIDNQKRMIVCWYGAAGDNNLFLSQLIAQALPSGYECTVPYPKDYAAVCTKKTPVPR
jgi:hypothetical protein